VGSQETSLFVRFFGGNCKPEGVAEANRAAMVVIIRGTSMLKNSFTLSHVGVTSM
jgi:hypothetical protein